MRTSKMKMMYKASISEDMEQCMEYSYTVGGTNWYNPFGKPIVIIC